MKHREDEILYCTVMKIEGTTVFVECEGGEQGSIVLSEVAAGRIRNLRKHVSVNRKIVCKVLKVCSDHYELSLRRVTSRERDEVLERVKKERALSSVLKVVGEDSGKILLKIKEKYGILEFLEKAKGEVKVFEEFLNKEKAAKVFEIFSEKEGKEKKVEGRFKLSTLEGGGVEDLKEILDVDVDVHYLGSSKFSISASAKDFKEANEKLEAALEEIKKRAEKKKAVFELVKGK